MYNLCILYIQHIHWSLGLREQTITQTTFYSCSSITTQTCGLSWQCPSYELCTLVTLHHHPLPGTLPRSLATAAG